MGGHSGRCFRDRRKTARRKVRQYMALGAMREVAAKNRNISPFALARLHDLTVWTMNEKQKRLMVQGYERARAKGFEPKRTVRRSARGG